MEQKLKAAYMNKERAAQIVEKDTAVVDVVSGATMTSVGIMSAVSDALAQAK